MYIMNLKCSLIRRYQHCSFTVKLSTDKTSPHFVDQRQIFFVHYFTFVPNKFQVRSSDTHTPTPTDLPRGLTLLAPLLLGAVNVVFELDADLPLVGLIPDEGVFQQLLGGRTLGVILHQAALNEAEELLRPSRLKLNVRFGVYSLI